MFFLLTGNVPELQSTPVSISFRIAIELATAVIPVWTGSVLKQEKTGTHELSAFAQGMLAYTVVNSPGYFAQSGAYALAVMFFCQAVLR